MFPAPVSSLHTPACFCVQVIVAHPLGACLLLKTPPLLPTPERPPPGVFAMPSALGFLLPVPACYPPAASSVFSSGSGLLLCCTAARPSCLLAPVVPFMVALQHLCCAPASCLFPCPGARIHHHLVIVAHARACACAATSAARLLPARVCYPPRKKLSGHLPHSSWLPVYCLLFLPCLLPAGLFLPLLCCPCACLLLASGRSCRLTACCLRLPCVPAACFLFLPGSAALHSSPPPINKTLPCSHTYKKTWQKTP